MKYDAFISHASEDKQEFVRPLAHALTNFGVKVWYDEFSLSLGDSLSRAIDQGLAKSDFGIVVLSKSFLSKSWPEHELRGLVAKEVGTKKVILPLWLGISRSELLDYSPTLADKLAVEAHPGNIIQTAIKIIGVVRPDLSEKIMRRATHLEAIRVAKTETVDIKKIQFGPPLHSELPFTLISRIRLIRAALFEVDPHSMGYWVDGFRRDSHPSREIRIWEHTAACFLEYTQSRRCSSTRRKAVYAVLILLSSAIGVEEIMKDGKFLKKSEVEAIAALYRAETSLLNAPDDDFPESYYTTEAADQLRSFDKEHFPYDVPDELVFDFLRQKPMDDES